jgi:hypothetical protein
VVREEKGSITKYGIDVGVLRVEVTRVVERWYLRRSERGWVRGDVDVVFHAS